MKQTYCNPLDLSYRYQHVISDEESTGFREGADPTLVLFKGKYYLFVSMSAGFWHSDDLLSWKFHADPELLIYDYAPDVRCIGDYLYFCASRNSKSCPIMRSSDPLNEAFTEVSSPFAFWDPDLFCDDDGRVYLYWGCSDSSPIFGIELDASTMLPIGEKKSLIFDCEDVLGFERPGENGIIKGADSLSGKDAPAKRPYIEGAFMTKHEGLYYLQYACPGTEYNIYSDGVYISKSPLGPFSLQESNPFSSNPGGFMTGAGHGSTIADKYGNYWHAATMRISVNHIFERRVGLFPAGFDADGVLYCNQNFADYPHRILSRHFSAVSLQPEWMLLSFKKPVTASSTAAGSLAENAVNENSRSWWSAASSAAGEWLCIDLEKSYDIRAIQVNMADEGLHISFSPDEYRDESHTRHIDITPLPSHYTIEASTDGVHWTLLEDVHRECVNGYYEYADGINARFIRVTGKKLPYDQPMRICGLRVFGIGSGEKPAKACASAQRLSGLDARVTWAHLDDAIGCNIRYGTSPDKLYQSWLVYDADEVTLCTLMAGREYYICVDSFNENGITPGEVFKLEA